MAVAAPRRNRADRDRLMTKDRRSPAGDRDVTPRTGAHPPNPHMAVIRPWPTPDSTPSGGLLLRGLRGFGVLVYRGRKSGAILRTPMNVFQRDGDWIFALTYSSDVQWVKNVWAAGEADLERGRDTIHLVEPRLFVDPRRRLMPFPI